MVDPLQILKEVLEIHGDADKWLGQPFERIKRLSNTKVGDVGQDFVEKLCDEVGFDCKFPEKLDGHRSRQSPWDIRMEGKTFEIKTATEDVSGCFQFNHIRYHRDYEALLCIGVAPSDVLMGAWSKAAVATGNAGKLVSMEKSGSASHKLTKRRDKLCPIIHFEDKILDVICSLEA